MIQRSGNPPSIDGVQGEEGGAARLARPVLANLL